MTFTASVWKLLDQPMYNRIFYLASGIGAILKFE